MRGVLEVDHATTDDLGAIAGLELGASVARTIGGDIDDTDRTCLVARLDGDVVGVALGLLAVDEGHVVDVAVAEPVRGQGIAVRLLAALEDELRTQGASALTLEVRPSNAAARGLYHRLGFVEEGRRRAYYPDGEDALVLWRRPSGGPTERASGGPTEEGPS